MTDETTPTLEDQRNDPARKVDLESWDAGFNQCLTFTQTYLKGVGGHLYAMGTEDEKAALLRKIANELVAPSQAHAKEVAESEYKIRANIIAAESVVPDSVVADLGDFSTEDKLGDPEE
jgi:hypothetical protein